jgi:hypothetical protein
VCGNVKPAGHPPRERPDGMRYSAVAALEDRFRRGLIWSVRPVDFAKDPVGVLWVQLDGARRGSDQFNGAAGFTPFSGLAAAVALTSWAGRAAPADPNAAAKPSSALVNSLGIIQTWLP